MADEIFPLDDEHSTQRRLVQSMEASFAKLQASQERRAALKRCDTSYGKASPPTHQSHATPVHIPLNDAPSYTAPTAADRICASAPPRYRSLGGSGDEDFMFRSSAVLSPAMVAFATPKPTTRGLEAPADFRRTSQGLPGFRGVPGFISAFGGRKDGLPGFDGMPSFGGGRKRSLSNAADEAKAQRQKQAVASFADTGAFSDEDEDDAGAPSSGFSGLSPRIF